MEKLVEQAIKEELQQLKERIELHQKCKVPHQGLLERVKRLEELEVLLK